jgi:LPS-assembly lipoprotein
MRALLVLASALLLAGCGFHLRGSTPVPPGMETVAVDDLSATTLENGGINAGNRGELRRAVQQSMRALGLTVADDAPVHVELLGESFNRRSASVDPRARTAEYELTYTLGFRVKGEDDCELVKDTRLESVRSYRFKQDAAVAASEEELVLRREMRRDIVSQLMRQFQQGVARGCPVDEKKKGDGKQGETAAGANDGKPGSGGDIAPAPEAATAPGAATGQADAAHGDAQP